jgi:hypothetical protein
VTDLGAQSEWGSERGRRFDDEPAAGWPEPLSVLQKLTDLLMAADTVEGVFRRVVTAARYVLPGTDLISITIRHPDGTSEMPVGIGEQAAEWARRSTGAEAAPASTRRPGRGRVRAQQRPRNETAWPTFAANATAQGYKSVLSIALLPNPGPVLFTGALNVY